MLRLNALMATDVRAAGLKSLRQVIFEDGKYWGQLSSTVAQHSRTDPGWPCCFPDVEPFERSSHLILLDAEGWNWSGSGEDGGWNRFFKPCMKLI